MQARRTWAAMFAVARRVVGHRIRVELVKVCPAAQLQGAGKGRRDGRTMRMPVGRMGGRQDGRQA